MEKRRGMVKGRAYLGPRRRLLMVLDPHRCLRTCVPVMSSLGRVASSSSCVSWSCHGWAVSPHHHCRVSGRVVAVPCHPGHSLPSHIISPSSSSV